MFAFLRGTLSEKAPGRAVVDIGGVGYEVRIPLSTFYELGEEGGEVHLRIITQIRDDSLVLYGFRTAAEQELFRHLIGVSGVGPRMAISILSGMAVGELVAALAEGDAARLQTIPGVGKRTAERLIVELKDRAGKLVASQTPAAARPSGRRVRDDLLSALINLGYPPAQAEKVTGETLADSPDGTAFEDLLRATLRRLHR